MSLLISQRERLFAYLDAVLELTDDKYQIQTRPPPPDRASTATSQSQSTTLHQQASQARIKELESKIQAVEMQGRVILHCNALTSISANIRQVQAKVLEIKIKQIELMVLVKQAQSVCFVVVGLLISTGNGAAWARSRIASKKERPRRAYVELTTPDSRDGA